MIATDAFSWDLRAASHFARRLLIRSRLCKVPKARRAKTVDTCMTQRDGNLDQGRK